MLSKLRLGIAFLAFFVFGCGGGGGGGGDGGGGGGGGGGINQPSSTPVAITSTNQQKAAEVAIEPALSGLNVLGTVTAAQITSSSPPRLTQVLRAAVSPLKEQLGAGQLAAGVIQTLACNISGSVSIDTASDGSSFTITFSACSDLTGMSINGSLSASAITLGSNNALSATFSIDITFVQTGQPTLRIVGNFSISETCPTSSTCTATFAGSSLGTLEGSEVWFLSNFSIAETVTSGSTSVTASYTVSSSVLGGSVSVSTTSPIVTLVGALYPQSGQILVTGAGSRVRVTINSSTPSSLTAVRVELDANNDGTFESSQFYSWTQLESA